MNEPELFVLADHTLKRVVDQITDEQWGMEMPPSLSQGHRQVAVTLREIVNGHAYDDAWVPDMLAGKTMDEVGATTFSGDLLGADPKGRFAAIVEAACAAAMALDDLERVVHCSFGDYTARQYFWQISSFRGLRAHDIARVLGIDPTLPPALVQGLWDVLSPVADEWRTYGVFGPAVVVPETADLQARLLGLTGRQP